MKDYTDQGQEYTLCDDNRYQYIRPNWKATILLFLLLAGFGLYFSVAPLLLLNFPDAWWVWGLGIVTMLGLAVLLFWAQITWIELAGNDSFRAMHAKACGGKPKAVLYEFVTMLSWFPILLLGMIEYDVLTDSTYPYRMLTLLCSILPALAVGIALTVLLLWGTWTLLSRIAGILYITVYGIAAYTALFISIVIFALCLCRLIAGDTG